MPAQDRLAELIARYENIREQTIGARQRMREISCTVVAPRQVVSVTVGRHGVLTEIKFPTGAYKSMTPKELAEVIVKTFQQAREKSLDEAADIMRPIMPNGIDVRTMMSGDVDFEQLLPKDPLARRNLFDQKPEGES